MLIGDNTLNGNLSDFPFKALMSITFPFLLLKANLGNKEVKHIEFTNISCFITAPALSFLEIYN